MSEELAELLLFHNFHPPDDVRVFPIPARGVRRRDQTTLVYDVRVGDLVLRRYSFADHWFEVNCTVDLRGGFVTEPGPIAWCLNCDISTPSLFVGPDEYNVDLCLDVLVGPDGREHVVKDEDEFERAVDQRWFTHEEQLGARRGLGELLALIRDGAFLAFLERICPFSSVACSDVPAALPMTCRPLRDIPLLHREVRGWEARS